MKRGARKFGRIVAATLATVLVVKSGMARPPVPKMEIVDTIRELAAEQLHIKKSDVDVRRSLSAQGMTENQLNELVIDIGQELGVSLSARAIFEAKQREPVQPLSVLMLADMVEARMLQPFPE